MVGREHRPEDAEDGVERVVLDRQCLGVAVPELDVEPFCQGSAAAVLQQGGDVVDADGVGPGPGCGQGGVAVSAGHVEHAPAGTQVRALGELLAHQDDAGRDHGEVPAGPGLLLLRLDCRQIGSGWWLTWCCSFVVRRHVPSSAPRMRAPQDPQRVAISYHRKAFGSRRRATETGQAGRDPPVASTVTGTRFVLPDDRRRVHHWSMSERGGDYCPISMGVDVLGDRWTPLVIRELMVGASGFNEIHRGLPRVSRTLLASDCASSSGSGCSSARSATRPPGWLQPDRGGSGADARGVGDGALGCRVGLRRPHGGRLRRAVPHLAAPPARHPSKLPASARSSRGAHGNGLRRAGSSSSRAGATVCKDDQGHDVDLAVEADTAQMHRWLLGRTSFPELVQAGMRACWGRVGWGGPSPRGST